MTDFRSRAPELSADELHDVLKETFFVFSPGGQMLRWNRRLNEVTGYSDEQIASMHPTEFVPEEERALIENRIQTVLDDGKAIVEAHYLTRDGRTLPYTFKGALRESNGQAFIYGRGEPRPPEEIHNSGAPLGKYLQQTLEELPVFLYAMDRDLRYTWVNSTFPGMIPEDFIGKTHREVYPKPEAERLEKLRRQVLETGRPTRTQFSATPDDTTHFIDTFIVPRYDREGTITGLVGASIDMTTGKTAEEQFQQLVNGVTEYAIFMLDPDGRITSWNEGARKIKGYEEAEIVGQHFSVFYTAEDRAKGEPEKMLEAAAHEGSIKSEGWRVRKDGSRFWASLSITALYSEEGRLRGYSKVTRDMTERRRREEQLTRQVQETRQVNRLLQLMQQVASTANSTDRLEEAFHEALNAVCEHTGWPLGHVYRMGDDEDLHTTGIWNSTSGEQFAVFRQVTRRANFQIGESLPGQVADQKQPVWIENVREDDRFIRRQINDEIEVKGAFAFPVLLGDEVIAVLEFFSDDVQERDDDLLEAMASVGTQLSRVAERERAAEQLRQSERRYRRLFEESQEAIFTTAADGQILEANPAGAQLFGYPREELLQMNVTQLYAHPENRDRIARRVEEQDGIKNLELQMRRKDGREITCQLAGTVLRDPEGNVRAFQAFVRDITEQKQAQQALQESEKKFRALAEQSTVGILLLQEGRLQYVNQALAEMYGYDRNELLDRTYVDLLVHPEDRTKVQRTIDRRLEATRDMRMTFQFRGVTKSGETIYVQAYGTGVEYEGRPTIIGTDIDITERRQLQQEILKIQEKERHRIGQELHDGIASHLTGIDMIFSGIINDVEGGCPADADELRQVKKMIKDAAEQTRKLSHGLNPVSIDAGGLPNALKELAAITQRRGSATCRYDGPGYISEDLPEHTVTHVYRIAQEAVSNAAKHAEADHISIGITETGDELVLCVEDDGLGLPKNSHSDGGIGFQTMRYRTDLLGGTMNVAGPSGGGTKLLFRVPI